MKKTPLLESAIELIPQHATRIAVNALLTIGILQIFRLLRKEISRLNT